MTIQLSQLLKPAAIALRCSPKVVHHFFIWFIQFFAFVIERIVIRVQLSVTSIFRHLKQNQLSQLHHKHSYFQAVTAVFLNKLFKAVTAVPEATFQTPFSAHWARNENLYCPFRELGCLCFCQSLPRLKFPITAESKKLAVIP